MGRAGLGTGVWGLAMTAWIGLAGAQTTVGSPLLAQNDAPFSMTPSAPPRVQTIAILILSGEESGAPLSEIYADARKAIERHTALSVAPLDTIGLAVREAAVRECAGKAACFAQKVRGGAAGQLLTVSVDRLGEDEGLLLGLRLVDVGSEQEIGATGDEVPVGMSLFGAMERQLAEVFPASVWDQIGTLVVTTEPPNAEVNVAGRNCASPCELRRLVPGTYETVIRKSGFIDWTGPITVVAQRSVTLNRELVEPEGSIVRSPWLWGGVGLAALGAGLAAVFLLQGNDRPVNICIANDRADCGGS